MRCSGHCSYNSDTNEGKMKSDTVVCARIDTDTKVRARRLYG